MQESKSARSENDAGQAGEIARKTGDERQAPIQEKFAMRGRESFLINRKHEQRLCNTIVFNRK